MPRQTLTYIQISKYIDLLMIFGNFTISFVKKYIWKCKIKKY